MERRQIWRKKVLFDEKSSLLPTPVSALSHFFDEISRFSANFAGVTLTPFLSALTTSTLVANPPRRRENPKSTGPHAEESKSEEIDKGARKKSRV